MLPDHHIATKRVIRHLLIFNAIVKGVEVPGSMTSNVPIQVQNCITHPHIASYSKVTSANNTSDIYKLLYFSLIIEPKVGSMAIIHLVPNKLI